LTGRPNIALCLSDSEAEIDDIAVLDDVLLAFQPQLPLVPRLGFAAAGHEVLVVDHLGPDEAALEVAVDPPCRSRGPVPSADGPGLDLILSHGEEGDEIQQLVGGANEARARRLGKPQGFEKLALVLWIELGDFRLDRGAKDEGLRAAWL